MGDSPYDSPLALTSPYMRGKRVRNAQWLLAGHNAWHDKPSPVCTYAGAIDGIYGIATASASRRAKFWLGYPSGEINGTFGTLLYNLLIGEAQLSGEYADRRAARLKAAEDPLKLTVLKLARQQVGTKESPFGSNCQKYGSWYGMNCVPWCAIFVSWCISHGTGKNWRYSFVPNILDDAVRGRNHMSLTLSPQPGDIVVYNWAGGAFDHVAFFDHWSDDRHNSFVDCGGNTSASDFANGGEVARQTRQVTITHRFIRLTF